MNMSHTLPALAYAYDALEPHIDALTMEIHHSRHHQAYINNLNSAPCRSAFLYPGIKLRIGGERHVHL